MGKNGCFSHTLWPALLSLTRAVGSSLKQGGPMMKSKPQVKHFTVVALHFPKNRLGQAHLAHTLTTTQYVEF